MHILIFFLINLKLINFIIIDLKNIYLIEKMKNKNIFKFIQNNYYYNSMSLKHMT